MIRGTASGNWLWPSTSMIWRLIRCSTSHIRLQDPAMWTVLIRPRTLMSLVRPRPKRKKEAGRGSGLTLAVPFLTADHDGGPDWKYVWLLVMP